MYLAESARYSAGARQARRKNLHELARHRKRTIPETGDDHGPDVASVAAGWLGLSPLVTTLWVSSFGFKLYVSNFGDYTATYRNGDRDDVMVLRLGVTILTGAELNAVIEQRIHSTADDAAAQ